MCSWTCWKNVQALSRLCRLGLRWILLWHVFKRYYPWTNPKNHLHNGGCFLNKHFIEFSWLFASSVTQGAMNQKSHSLLCGFPTDKTYSVSMELGTRGSLKSLCWWNVSCYLRTFGSQVLPPMLKTIIVPVKRAHFPTTEWQFWIHWKHSETYLVTVVLLVCLWDCHVLCLCCCFFL